MISSCWPLARSTQATAVTGPMDRINFLKVTVPSLGAPSAARMSSTPSSKSVLMGREAMTPRTPSSSLCSIWLHCFLQQDKMSLSNFRSPGLVTHSGTILPKSVDWITSPVLRPYSQASPNIVLAPWSDVSRTTLMLATSGMIVCENWLLRGLTESSSNGRLCAKTHSSPPSRNRGRFCPAVLHRWCGVPRTGSRWVEGLARRPSRASSRITE
mmetsp:Transcript_2777/g.8107  ORF Transcript_2777/g.8107 Transcript_2777/m.8107 type:complete len:213 (+) Transcript_2777:259-897(+)